MSICARADTTLASAVGAMRLLRRQSGYINTANHENSILDSAHSVGHDAPVTNNPARWVGSVGGREMSYEFRGTPGPWVVSHDGPSLPIVIERDGALVIGGCSYQDSMEEANARLIAAAPELFEALNELLGHVSSVQVGSVYDEAQAALAKATGDKA